MNPPHPRPIPSTLLAAAALLVTCVACGACGDPVRVEIAESVDGAPVRLRAYVGSEAVGTRLTEDVLASLREFSEASDRRRADSRLARINEAARAGFHEIEDADLYRCILLAHDWANASRGAYDPMLGPLLDLYAFEVERGRVPGPSAIDSRVSVSGRSRLRVAHEARAVGFDSPEAALDLTGIRRGFAIDLAARAFASSGVTAARLAFDGTVYAWAAPPGAAAWEADLVDPADRSRVLLTLELSSRAASVAGAPADPTAIDDRWLAERLDATTGVPVANRLLAAVAVADSAAEADAIADALYVGGYRRAAALLERSRRVEGVLLLRGDDGPTLLASASLRGRLSPGPELAAAVDDRIRYILPPQTTAVIPDVR